MTPFAIHTYGAKPHQTGYAFANDAGRSTWVPGRSSDADNPNGPVKVHVASGKALTPQGRRLLRKTS